MAAPPPLPGEDNSPPPLPADKQTDPPRGRKFPCRQCGAKLDFDPAARGLKCPYCGFTEVIPEAEDDERSSIREHDLEAFLEEHEHRAEVSVSDRYSQVKCEGCGAVVVMQDRLATDKCPYCGTHLENKPEAIEHLIVPESLLPFTVSDREARDRFNKWLHSLWFAPTELKQLANLGQFGSVYAPYWTYDAMTYTPYIHRPAGGRLLGHRVLHAEWQAAVAARPEDAMALGVRRGPTLLRRHPHQGIAYTPG